MFHTARIKLTLWYLLSILMVSGVFSLVFFQIQTAELDRFEQSRKLRLEKRWQQSELLLPPERMANPLMFADPELIDELKGRLLIFLLEVNGGVLVLAGVLGYFLAGRTLQPISVMVEEQDRFISDASHELRTPLTSLKSALEVYLRDKTRNVKEADKLVSESVTDVNRIQKLTEGLLSLAMYKKSNRILNFEKIRIGEIIKSGVREVEVKAKLKRVKIVSKVGGMEIWGERQGLVNLLVILLDNAIKYSQKETVVRVVAKTCKGGVKLMVIDKGVGIDEKDLPHVFDRFFRADEARVKNIAGGYGLGLAIAKEIVESHGGSIEVKSKYGEGSKFIVYLPTGRK
jgi:two-component system, OmpR family, sensor histidine kinase CiaH